MIKQSEQPPTNRLRSAGIATDRGTGDVEPLAVDAKRLSKLLTVSVRTVRAMDAAGKLPRSVKLNGHSVRWIVDGPKGIQAWLEAGAPDRATWEILRGDEIKKRT